MGDGDGSSLEEKQTGLVDCNLTDSAGKKAHLIRKVGGEDIHIFCWTYESG